MEYVIFAVAALLFLVIASMIYGVYLLLSPTRTAGDRLRDLRADEGAGEVEIDILLNRDDDENNPLTKMFAPASEEDRNIMRRKLVQAGFRHKHALEILSSTRILLAIFLPLILMPFALTFQLHWAVLIVAGTAALGYFGPYLLVENNITKRKNELLKQFPDSLDLLVSSVEAGLGIDAAFRRVAAEMEQAAPALAREYQMVNHEISAGVPRVEALRHLERRTGLDEIRSLVNMLAQAERFGTSIAASLRVHATVTRQKRMSKAEEEAAKVSPKLTIVMILFLLPVLKLVLLGPAMIQVYRTFYG